MAYTEIIDGEAKLDDETIYCCSERSPRDEELKGVFIFLCTASFICIYRSGWNPD